MENTKIKQIKGSAIPMLEDDIDTDRIMPARFLKEITFAKMGEFVFADVRFDEKGKSLNHILDNPDYQGAAFLFVGKNFGCGSSREHAPQGIKRYGIKAIIGESFAEIFAGNCKSLGIPLVTASKENIAILAAAAKSDPKTIFTLDLESQTISDNKNSFKIGIPADFRQAFLNGLWDSTSLLKANIDKIKKMAGNLPY